jgi:hypothetical protein
MTEQLQTALDQFQNLYYTPDDKMLFWVAGYTADDHTDSVVAKTEYLLENAQKFATKVGCKLDEVKTYYNNRPPRFQYMRVFYIKTESHKVDGVFEWGEGWTMNEVLSS